MDQTTFLVVTITILSSVLVIVGVYAVFVIRDLRQTLRHLNKILGRVDSITEHVDASIIRPSSSLAGVLALLRQGAQVMGEIKDLSQTAGATAQAISREVKEAAQVVKDDLAPVVREEAKEIAAVVKDDVKEIINEAADSSKEVVNSATEDVKESVAEITRPEPQAARSLAPRRRFHSKKR